MRCVDRRLRTILAIGTIVAAATALPATAAFPVADAQAYLGGWRIDMDFMGQTVEMSIEFLDEDGSLVALLRSPQGDQRITDIAAADEGLRLLFESPFGEMSIDTHLESDELFGVFRIPGANIEADFQGVRGQADVALAGGGGASLFGRPAPRTRLEIGEDSVVIRFPDPESARAELTPAPDGGEGHELHFAGASAVQLRTDLSLRFDGTVIEAGNFGPDYPGIYSLWLKRVGEEWSLVVNGEGDIWGTQHDPAFDVTEIDLDFKLLDEPVEELDWKLEEADGGGNLRIVFDRYELSTSFESLAADSQQ